MSTDLPSLPLGRPDWVRRCAARIRELDDVVSLVDAVDLASTLFELPCCEALDPETAAARLFMDDLTPSQWTDLASLRGTRDD
ncbi:MAG: hypothetical protein M3O01_03260 [Pseudomonadota bacterium]|nr:hypothetical protein [Pseudomonadota bacterium]